MSKLKSLKSCENLKDLSLLLGYTPSSLAYILYKIPPDKKYIQFSIPKKSGGLRNIDAPIPKLKKLQKLLSILLRDCISEIQEHKKILSASFAYKKGDSVYKNANYHRNKRIIVNLDLEEFFPSINFGRVYGYFIKDNRFRLNPKVSTLISQIACNNNALPQGSPCSPIISDLIANIMDRRLLEYAKQYKLSYTRYADDITFSTNLKKLPRELAVKIGNVYKVSPKLKGIIERSGFKVNEKKTSVQFYYSRQVVTGIVVNKVLNVKKEYYKRARSMVMNFISSGSYKFSGSIISNSAPLEGILNYIRYTKSKSLSYNEKSLVGINKVQAKLLIWNLFNPKCLRIITEGKTDIKYLKSASEVLGSINNYIGDLSKRVNFLKFSKTMKSIFCVSQNSNAFRVLVKRKEELITFPHKNSEFPVIFLLDNDSGIKDTKKILQTSRSLSPLNDVYHYSDNIYIVLVKSEKGTSIEDCFDKATREIKVEGKTFNRTNEKLKDNEYGKEVFAEKVVKEMKGSISFEGFLTVFESIEMVEKDYANIRNRV